MLPMLMTTNLAAQDDFNYAVVRASWTAPCVGSEPPCGSPAVSYVLQIRYEGDTDWTSYATSDTTYVDVQIDLFVPVQARVAGVDAQDRQGPYSEPSEWYVADFGPPAATLAPEWVIDTPTPAPKPLPELPDLDSKPVR